MQEPQAPAVLQGKSLPEQAGATTPMDPGSSGGDWEGSGSCSPAAMQMSPQEGLNPGVTVCALGHLTGCPQGRASQGSAGPVPIPELTACPATCSVPRAGAQRRVEVRVGAGVGARSQPAWPHHALPGFLPAVPGICLPAELEVRH